MSEFEYVDLGEGSVSKKRRMIRRVDISTWRRSEKSISM